MSCSKERMRIRIDRSTCITKSNFLYERGFTDEEVSPGRRRHSFTGSECSICPGCRTRRASRSHCRAPPCSSRTQVRLDRRISPLGRPSLRLGVRPLGDAPACRRSLGSRTLGRPLRRMGVGWRPLALTPRTSWETSAPASVAPRLLTFNGDYLSEPLLGPALR